MTRLSCQKEPRMTLENEIFQQEPIMPNTTTRLDRLAAINQQHLLKFTDKLNDSQLQQLHDQIDQLDFDQLPALVQEYVLNKPTISVPDKINPAEFFPADPGHPSRPWDADEAKTKGCDLIKAGKVAAFTVAGGQGSRLGYDGPKGCFSAGAVSGKSLFAIFAEKLQAAMRKYDTTIVWYIMTSPLNHDQTVSFFKSKHFFGLNPGDVSFFPQGVLPSFDAQTGGILLTQHHQIATNPDGHGGSLTALHASGALADMQGRGIEQISYFQVDNPLVQIIDPVFLGLHVTAGVSSGEVSSKMIQKTYPAERVGVFCEINGRVQMVEYSDLSQTLQEQRNADGSLRFASGNPAIHLLSVDFVQKVNTDSDFSLPYHRADKKIEHVDLKTGQIIKPEANNGVKLERFVFDALPMCQKSMVLETIREDEFAPIKNANGQDSAETSSQLQTERAARWLEAAGVKVPRDANGRVDCVLELSPLTALEPDDLASASLPKRIEPGEKLAL